MRLFMPPLRHQRHPLMQVLATVVGVAMLGFLFVFGLVALSVLLVVGLVLLAVRQWRMRHVGPHAPPPGPPPGVIEGEFVVVESRRHNVR